MRDIFCEIFERAAIDPTEAARRAMRPQLRRRFYDAVTIVEDDNIFAIALDGKPVRTPAGRSLAAPARELAEALAAEWDAQREAVNPATMPLTRLANSIIDGVADAPAAVAAEIAKYLGSDLVFYRAARPERLVARQAQAWDPVVAWAREAIGARFLLGEEVTYVAQPPEAIAAACALIPAAAGGARDLWRLGAVHVVTTLTSSALIALALLYGRLTADQAWTTAHVDEDWNMELWGPDVLALQNRSFREAEMKAAALVLEALR